MNYDEPHNGKPHDLRGLVFRAVVAALVAMLLLAAAYWAYFNLASEKFRQETQQFAAEMPGRLQEQFSSLKKSGDVLVEKAANSPLLDLNREQREKEEQEARARRARELAAAKEAAWEKFYEPAPECSNPATDAQFVACGNAYHKAKVAFEARWRAGSGPEADTAEADR